MSTGNLKTVAVFGGFVLAAGLAILKWWLCVPGFALAVLFAYTWRPNN